MNKPIDFERLVNGNIKYELLNEIIKNYKKKLKTISIEIGNKFLKKGDDPEGILIIKEGIMSVLLTDQNNNTEFTVQQLRKGELAGLDQLICSRKDSEIIASTKIKGFFLEKKYFLEISSLKSKIMNTLINQSSYELYSTISIFIFGKIIKSHEVFKLLNNSLFNEISKNLNPGINNLKSDFGTFLLTSSNVEGFKIGDIVKGPITINVFGNFPARLIKINPKWSELKKVSESKSEINNNYNQFDEITNKFNQQKNGLEDTYGPKYQDLNFPHIEGEGVIDESIACLRMIARFFDLPFKKDLIIRVLENQFINSKENKFSLPQYAAIFELLGFKVYPINISNIELIKRINLPAFALCDGKPKIIWLSERDKFLISDPQSNQKWQMAKDFFASSNNRLDILLIEKTLKNKESKFGLSWFIPVLKKHKANLIQVVFASFFVQLLALFNPLLIQQIFDAVISQGNLSSLNILGTILISMALAQALLGSLRTFLFSDTTNQIDRTLGSSIIHHLLRLPINYFARRSVGELNGRINELEKIRKFLTSTAITVFLDAIFSLIYIAVMMLYSTKLTFMSLAILPIFVIFTLIVSPINKKQLRIHSESKALVQSHLVESLNGIETIKGQGMEIYSQWRWEQLYSKQIKNGFNNIITNTISGSASQFLSQLSGLIVIWGGASLVLKGEMTLGQLIAFRILSGYVTSPILRLTSTWQNFQDIALSIERLGDVIDTKKENDLYGENLPPLGNIKGNVAFENVSLKFKNNDNYQLKNISFEAKKGDFIAVIGSSGSGKSTLMKLLMRLYKPSEGTIKVDNNDINKFDLNSLRNQIGFVPQETILFNGTIQSNISLTKPEASFEEIRDAAKVANADNFIQELSKGYGNDIGEKGFKISGGQKQRLSIARMIIKNPNIVILDEATSSLDKENEKTVLFNIIKKFKNKTIFFVTHKLDNMELFNQILFMEKGEIIEIGNHNELMNNKGKYYSLITRNNKTN